MSSAVGRMAVRDDAMEGDVAEAGRVAVEQLEHAVDGSPESALEVQQNERGSVAEEPQQVPAKPFFRGGKRRPGSRDGACIAGLAVRPKVGPTPGWPYARSRGGSAGSDDRSAALAGDLAHVVDEALNGVRASEREAQRRRAVHRVADGGLALGALGRQVSPGAEENEEGLRGGTAATGRGRGDGGCVPPDTRRSVDAGPRIQEQGDNDSMIIFGRLV